MYVPVLVALQVSKHFAEVSEVALEKVCRAHRWSLAKISQGRCCKHALPLASALQVLWTDICPQQRVYLFALINADPHSSVSMRHALAI